MADVFKASVKCREYKRSVRKVLLEVFVDIDQVYGTRFKNVYRRFVRHQRDQDKELLSKRSCSEELKEFKYLTAGLLDSMNGGNGYGHPLWTGTRLKACATRRQERRRGLLSKERILCIASALVSGKKRLPNPCTCLVRDMERNTIGLLSNEDRDLPTGYLNHCSRTLERMFGGRNTGSSTYADYVDRHVLSLGACRGVSRSNGGQKGLSLWTREEWMELHSDAASFEELVYRVSERGPTEKPIVGYKLVIGGGKARGITMNEGNHAVLAPLHKQLYDCISRERWLLRGDANALKFKGWSHLKEGELFVSGDYTSATDNLQIRVAKVILAKMMTLLGTPDYIRKFALRSLECTIEDSEGVLHEQQRGQLMGSLLSFPLLCLQNYLAFRWFVDYDECPDDRVRINGDDIVFVAVESVIERWMEGVKELGLELSSGKTFIDDRFFSLNSTYFWACKGYIKCMPVVRLGTLMRTSMGKLGAALNDFLKPLGGERSITRSRAIAGFMKRHRTLVKRYKGSWTREIPYGLEAKIFADELRDEGLLGQECYYRSIACGASPSIDSINNFEVPPEFRLIRSSAARKGANVPDLFVEWHWSTDIKLKNKKQVDTRYESELLRLRSQPENYVEVGFSLDYRCPVLEPFGVWRRDASEVLNTGFRLLSVRDRKVGLAMIGSELTHICEAIDASASREQTSKVTSLIRKNRFDYMFRRCFEDPEEGRFTWIRESDELLGPRIETPLQREALASLTTAYQDLYGVGTVEDDSVEAGIRYA